MGSTLPVWLTSVMAWTKAFLKKPQGQAVTHDDYICQGQGTTIGCAFMPKLFPILDYMCNILLKQS